MRVSAKLAVLAVNVLALSLVPLSQTAAHADPTPPCYGSACNGKDPQSMGCAGSNAYTVTSFNIDHGFATVSLRYSDWCHANWATVSTHINGGDGGEFWVENKNHDAQYWGFDEGNIPTTFWTNMVNGVPLARACVKDNVSFPGSPGCTGWK